MHADKAYFDLSDEIIKIQTNFNGREIIIFGLADPNYDTILVIKGPKKDAKLSIKERLFGIWIETKQFTYKNIPSIQIYQNLKIYQNRNIYRNITTYITYGKMGPTWAPMGPGRGPGPAPPPPGLSPPPPLPGARPGPRARGSSPLPLPIPPPHTKDSKHIPKYTFIYIYIYILIRSESTRAQRTLSVRVSVCPGFGGLYKQ